MNLERYQRGLLDLVKNRGGESQDPYFRLVAGSRQIAVVREIAVWWRIFQIEAQCHFTSRLLKRRGCFHDAVEAYFDSNRTSPFVEELSRSFLLSLHGHADRLIGAAAQFDYGFLEVRAGKAEEFEVLWDRNPDLVFHALDRGGELPVPESECIYRMRIGAEIPGLVACTRETANVNAKS